jgi:predicted O-methyltransferase YrrM
MSIVHHKLIDLHDDAKKDFMRVGKGIVKSVFRPLKPIDFEQAYLPISKDQGFALQELVIENNCKNIIEFGTSFGISTIYLADAVRKTGGKVITTEILGSKAQRAIRNIDDAGLSDYVEVKIGDAMKSLKDHKAPVDFLFLDGWKDLYLPLFQMLEPYFHSRTLIYADNMDMTGTQDYATYVLNKTNAYSTEFVHNKKAFLTKINH